MKKILFIVPALLAAAPVQAQQAAKIDPATIEAITKATFKSAPESWLARVDQDETQKVCSQYRNDLPTAEFDKVNQRE